MTQNEKGPNRSAVVSPSSLEKRQTFILQLRREMKNLTFLVMGLPRGDITGAGKDDSALRSVTKLEKQSGPGDSILHYLSGSVVQVGFEETSTWVAPLPKSAKPWERV